MKADAERGTWGAWARKERLARDWTVDEVVRRVSVEAHVRMDVATLRGIEGGSKKPSVRLQDALALVFGSRPQQAPAQPTDANLRIIALLEEQTDELRKLWPAINRLADAIDRSDSRAREQTVAVAGAIGRLAEDFAEQSEIRAGRTDAVADAMHLMNQKLDALVARTGSDGARALPPVREPK